MLDTTGLTNALVTAGFDAAAAQAVANAMTTFVKSGTVVPGTFANGSGPVTGTGSIE